jgi:hypothetical protein
VGHHQQVSVAAARTDHAALVLPSEQQGYAEAMVNTTTVGVPALPPMMQTEWDKNLGDLKAFKERFGHTNVTANDNKDLGAWVFFQKQQYRNFLSGQSTSLTADQVQQLQQVSCSTLLFILFSTYVTRKKYPLTISRHVQLAAWLRFRCAITSQ